MSTVDKELLESAQLALTLLDALRIDSNIGIHLLDYEKESYEFVTENLRDTLERVQDER